MGLDYTGKSSFKRERDLILSKLNSNKVDSVLSTTSDEDPEEDAIFDNIARVFLKGEALKEGIGDMNPAAFVPVEDNAAVLASIARLDSTLASRQAITFGLYKEACEFIAERSGVIDEKFLATWNIVDPQNEHTQFTKKYKGVTSDGNDWITDFLEMLLPFAGLTIAGFLTDIFVTAQPRPTYGLNEVKQFSSHGFLVGIALLIELGVNAYSLYTLFNTESSISSPEIKNAIDKYSDQAARQAVLEEAGYNYELFRKNQSFNDYKAVKDYALKYICANPGKLNYDHWVAYLRIIESQSTLQSGMAMAPMFSNKWQEFRNKSTKIEVLGGELEGSGLIEEQVKSALTVGLKSYLSNLYAINNDTYNKYASSFTLRIDERYLCCILYFIGDIDSKILRGISSMLKLGLFKVEFKFKDLIKTLIDNVQSSMINLLVANLNQYLDQIVSKITKQLFSIPETDLNAAIKYCVGIEILLQALNFSIEAIVALLDDIVSQLNALLKVGELKTAAEVSAYVDRKYLATLTGFLDALASKLDQAKLVCQLDENADAINFDDVTSKAALNFVIDELPEMYPILDLPEAVRRKHFRNVDNFLTDNLQVEVPGFNDTGAPIPILENAVDDDCSSDSAPASRAIEIANRISKSIKESSNVVV